jgi:ABC-2 type transport system permease protein
VSKHHLLARGPTALLLQTTAVARKELTELVRQPRLVLTLIVGPFAILILFGGSYREDSVLMRTLFVGPPGSAYERAIDQYESELAAYVRVAGFTSDQPAAEKLLRDHDVDLVVVFPPDADQRVMNGEQAEIQVLNDKLDPLQQSAVEIAARLAVQEMNASIVSNVVADAQSLAQPMQGFLDGSLEAGAAASAAAERDDTLAMDEALDDVRSDLDDLHRAATVTDRALGELSGSGVDEPGGRLRDVVTTVESAQALAGSAPMTEDPAARRARMARLNDTLEEIRGPVAEFAEIDPAVLVRPFTSRTYTVLPERILPTDFFAPSSIALLLQHMAVSFAALALVRDRAMGLIEIFRVGPTSVASIISGRFLAFLLAGAVVGAALVASVVRLLDVPMLGSYAWLAASLLLLVFASTALGMVLALVSTTDSQAVQYAMLVLLASLFFGGFVLDLSLFDHPARTVSWLLPITYGIPLAQHSMLRGIPPATSDFIGLGAQAAVYTLLAVFLFRRRLRVE